MFAPSSEEHQIPRGRQYDFLIESASTRTKLFVEIDNFYKSFEPEYHKSLLSEGKVKRRRSTTLSMSEIMTIVVFFHMYKFRTFNDYYIRYVQKSLKSAFPALVSYQRFVELMPRVRFYFSHLCSKDDWDR